HIDQSTLGTRPGYLANFLGSGKLAVPLPKIPTSLKSKIATLKATPTLLKAGPRAPAAWYGLAKLYLIQGKFEQAEKWAGMVVDSGQGDEGARAMLQAAKGKKLSDGLRLMLEPQ